MKKRVKSTLITLLILVVIGTLIKLQYDYAHKTKIYENLKYEATVEVSDQSKVLIFKNSNEFIGFEGNNEISRKLVKGEFYDVEYNSEKWHRASILIEDATKEEE